MSTYPFLQVDAFTTQPLSGNPCAVILDAGSLDEATMQAIAREMNLSETAFLAPSTRADFGARFFTPAEEIPMAGHPTIASVYALWETGRLALVGDVTTITLELKAGVIPVDIFAHQGKIERIVMSQITPVFLNALDPAEVLPAFGLAAGDLLPGAPLEVVSTGTPQLMVPLKELASLHRISVNLPEYRKLRQNAGFFSPHLFCLQGITPAGSTFARHFGLPPDTPEDPFTGSATGGMAAYLWHHGLIATPFFIAEQGHWMQRPGQATVEVIGPRDAIQTVRVGGAAVTVLSGTLTL